MTDRRPGRDPSTEHLSDHGLLALTARGDRDAFARLYDMYGGAAYALALRIVRDRELSADVVQDAFLTVWRQASKFDAARGQPSTWILTLTHHKAVDCRETHGGRHAAPPMHGAQARAITEMRDHDPSVGQLRRNLRQTRGDILVGQPMKSVPADTRFCELARKRE